MPREYSDMTIAEFRQALKDGPYTSLGSYPVFFITSDGGALSYKTAKEEREQIEEAIHEKSRNGWRVVAVDVNWEDPELYDDHSGERIQSAYAEDEASDSDEPQLKLPFRRNPSRRKKKSMARRRKRSRRNPSVTQEGRVLRTEGHSKHDASKLLLSRKSARKSHKRLPRRSGTLTFQSAQEVLHGSSRSGSSRSSSSSKRSRSKAPSVRPTRSRVEYVTTPGEMDVFDWMESIWG